METTFQQPADWEVHPLLTKEQFAGALHVGIERLHAQLLYNRGIKTPEDMRIFIDAKYEYTRDPLTLIDMPRAVARIQRALENQEHITVYGDYDADGITSSALLFRALRTLKTAATPLDYHIPHRLRDGCGLNLAALDLLKARGTQLIITTDCASSDIEQVEYARKLGMEVIITDHHHPPDTLPNAHAMINPWRPDCTYGERYLCGVGIAFKLTQALYRAYSRPPQEEMALLDLVAIGTVADIAPLLGENHMLVHLGMQYLNTTKKPGLRALIRSTNLPMGRIRERDIAFGIAPRINAAGRMKDASIAFDLLTTDSEEEAAVHVAELEQLNLSRQQETEELMRYVREQASHQPDKSVILVNGDDWHEGLIGLVAGKLVEELHKPVLVLSNDKNTQLSRGSARSQKGFNIIEALHGFSQHLERYGGHAQAAGFTIHSKHIEKFHTYLIDWKDNGGAPLPAVIEGTSLPDQTGVIIEQAPPENMPSPNQVLIDLTFTRVDTINNELYKQVRMLSPFGAGNPEPTFKVANIQLLDKWLSGVNRQNLRLRLGTASGKQLTGTLTRGAAQLPLLKGCEHVNLVFKLDAFENETKQDVWLKIVSVEPV